MESLLQLFHKASLREKVLLVGILLGVLMLLLARLVWEPQWLARQQSLEKLHAMASDLIALQAESNALTLAIARDVDEEVRRDNERLRAAISVQQKLLAAGMQRLVTPEEMVQILADLLTENPGLQLTVVKKLPAERTVQGMEAAEASVALFNHRVQIGFKGNFFDTLRYIWRVEESMPRLRWSKMDYRVADYPVADVLLEFETLAIDERWLGI